MIRNYAEFSRALPAGFDGEFQWDFLKGAFGPTIEPMDFDAVVERRGHFLVFETKNDSQEMSSGQEIALTSLFRPRSFEIVLCEKDPADIRHWTIWTKDGQKHFVGDAVALKAWCEQWYQRVSR